MSSILIVRSKPQRPRISGDLIVPGDLLVRLAMAGTRLLTLLVAPAGHGKTSLVAHWLGGRGGLAAWLALDQTDGDPIVFASYRVAVVRTAVPGPASRRREILRPGGRRCRRDLQLGRRETALLLDRRAGRAVNSPAFASPSGLVRFPRDGIIAMDMRIPIHMLVKRYVS